MKHRINNEIQYYADIEIKLLEIIEKMRNIQEDILNSIEDTEIRCNDLKIIIENFIKRKEGLDEFSNEDKIRLENEIDFHINECYIKIEECEMLIKNFEEQYKQTKEIEDNANKELLNAINKQTELLEE
jgi:hypothetical protein